MRRSIVVVAVVCLFFSVCISEAMASGEGATASSIDLNVAYRGTISTSDEIDWYKFDVVPNQRYYILVWADNLFGTKPSGLKDTSVTAYLNRGGQQISSYFNNDAPIWMNMGYGSRLIIEAIPSGVTPVRVTQCVAPSSVTFSIEQEDLAPETGTYSFKVLVDEMPKNAAGGYDYSVPMENSLITGAVNPPTSTIQAPESVDTGVIDQTVTLNIAINSGSVPFTINPRVYYNGIDVTASSTFLYGDPPGNVWDSTSSHVYDTPGSFSVVAKYNHNGTNLTSTTVSVTVLPEQDDQPGSEDGPSTMATAPYIELNVAYNGSISTVDEQDWYKFDVVPNQRYYILVWADNLFGTKPSGLKDTSVTAYLNRGGQQISSYFNNDAPIWMNMGYGSRLIIEAIPSGVTPVRVTQCVAPSSVTFSIEQEDLAPETGTYSFKVLVDEMPKNAAGGYDYSVPMENSLITGAVNPPSSTIAAPTAVVQNLVLQLTNTSGYIPFVINPRVFLDGQDVTLSCFFSYGDMGQQSWVSDATHEYSTPGIYSVVAKYNDENVELTSSPLAVTIMEQQNVNDFSFSLKAIDVEEQLDLYGSAGIHVYIWAGGDSFGQALDQFFVCNMGDTWYALNDSRRWIPFDVNSPDIIRDLPLLRTAPFVANSKETFFSIPDFMLPYGTIQCFYCIDNEIDGKLTLDKSVCKPLIIRHFSEE